MFQKYGRMLVICAVMVSTPRYMAAFLAADMGGTIHVEWVNQLLTVAMGISGIFMGPLEVLSSVFLLAALGKIKPRVGSKQTLNRRYVGVLGFVIALHVLGVIVIAPYIVSSFPEMSMAKALANSPAGYYIWSVSVAIMPMLVVGGVEYSGFGLLSESKTQTTSRKVAGKLPEKKDSGRKGADRSGKRNPPPTPSATYANDNGKVETVNSGTLSADERLGIKDIRHIHGNVDELRFIASLGTGSAVVQHYGIASDRTGRNWIKQAKELISPVTSENGSG